MSDLVATFQPLLELAFIAILGYFVGNAFYRLFLLFARRISKWTKSGLDDMILEYVQGPLEVAIILLFVYFLSNAFPDLAPIRTTIDRYLAAILILLGAYVVSEIFGAVLRWYYVEGKEKSKFKMDITLLPLLRKLTRVAILFLGATTSLSILGFDVSGVFALTSILAIIIGLASQETLGNFFAGMALQFDRPFVYGEFLRFPTGEVAKLLKIGLRSTRFEDLNGNLMVYSNSEFAKQRMTNLSRPTQAFKSSLSLEVGLQTDLEALQAHLSKKLAASNVPGLRPDSVTVAIERITHDGIFIQVRFWVSEYSKLDAVREAVSRSVLEFVQK